MAAAMHGEERVDEYAWLRGGSDQPWLDELLRSEREYASAVVGDGRGIAADYQSFVNRHFVPPPVREFSARGATFRWNGSRLERRAASNGRWKTVFDTEVYGARAGGGGVTNVALSPSGRTVAISLHRTGTEHWMLRFRDVERGRDRRVLLEGVGPDAAWISDERVLVSRVDETGRPVSVHAFDLDIGLGPAVYESRSPTSWLTIGQLPDGQHAVLSGEGLWLAGPETSTELVRIEPPVEQQLVGMGYSSARHRLVVHTLGEDATEAIRTAPVTDTGVGEWTERFRADPAETIDGMAAHDEAVVALVRARGVPSLALLGYDGEPVRRVALAGDVSTSIDLYDAATPSTPTSVRVAIRTPVDAGSILSLDVGRGALEHRETIARPTRWDQAGAASRVDWVRSDDGVEVPMTIVHAAGVTLPAPVILHGYGAYELSSRVVPSANALFWLSRGWVLATAHVRGGGELGPRWHRAGYRRLKDRSIADFVVCADHLVANGITAPSLLAAEGGSAGGLLVCGAAVRRPDLFAAVVAHNPVTDVIEMLEDRSNRLAGPSINEFGNIFDDAEMYAAVKRYNPFDNVTFADYPAFLFTTGRADERVPWWHAARLALRLRAFTTGPRPIVLDISTHAGHTGGSGFSHDPSTRAAAFLTKIIGR